MGKSSLINLLAGKKVSETSSGALGCTLEYKRHLLDLGGDQHFAVWDTAGLDEGTEGSVPADKAEAYLKRLLHELAKNNGVDLLVYCVRGTRVRSALLTNYHIFYSAICRKKVPIAIVITGLENQEVNMETWWYKNEHQFSLFKMYFDSHACVTTLESSVENPLVKERRDLSRTAVIKMITSTCRTQQWRPHERSWVESAYSDIRAMLSPRDIHRSRLPTIIICETSRDRPGSRLTRKRSISFQNPVAFSLSLHPLSFRSPVSVSNDSSRNKLPFEEGIKYTPERLYRVYQVSPKPVPLSEGVDERTSKAVIVKRGADLLIFCVRMEGSQSRAVKFQWEHFNSTYSGDLSPRIVVVIGASNQLIAERWWQNTVGGTLVKNDVDVAHCPLDATGIEAEAAVRRRLQLLIHDRCIDCSKGTLVRNEKLFKRPLLLDMSNLVALGKPEYDKRGDELPIGQDILTKVGVWYDMPERSASMTSPVSPETLIPFPRQ